MKKILWMHSHFKLWMGGTDLVFQFVSRLYRIVPICVLVEDFSELALQNYAKINVEIIKTIGTTSNSPYYWLNLPYFIRKNRNIVSRFIDKDTLLMSSMFPMNVVLNDFDRPKFQYLFEPFAYIHDQTLIRGLETPKRLFCRYVSWRYKKWDIEATRKSDRVFTLNDVTAKSNQKVYGIDSIPTYTGIDSEFFKPSNSPDLEKKYNGRRILIHSTDFTPIKGTINCLKIISIVKKRYPNVLLLITSTVASDSGFRNLTQLARLLHVEDNIEYLGFLPMEDVPRYYAFAEILMQTGVGESGAVSFSLPVKQAMSCGTPVIRHPITSEDAEHGVSGYLIDSLDAEKYAEGIVDLLDHPDKAKRMGKKARDRIMGNYTWDRAIARLLEHLQ